MLDHVFLSTPNLPRSLTFYEKALAPLGITHYVDYDGKLGPPNHPDLKGFGKNKRAFFWLKQGPAAPHSIHIGFTADSTAQVDAFHTAALAAGATDNGPPAYRTYYDPRYYAANILDPDGHSIEVVYKNWQHPQP